MVGWGRGHDGMGKRTWWDGEEDMEMGKKTMVDMGKGAWLGCSRGGMRTSWDGRSLRVPIPSFSFWTPKR